MAASGRAADTTVRVDRRTSATLKRLSKETGKAKKELIAQAVEKMRRERALEAANAGFAAIRRDKVAWRAELEERALWDSTVADGLKRE